jgi:hypothetical protein
MNRDLPAEMMTRHHEPLPAPSFRAAVIVISEKSLVHPEPLFLKERFLVRSE